MNLMQCLIEDENNCLSPLLQEKLTQACNQCMVVENITSPCCIGLMIIDNHEIQEINRSTRQMDRPTDVLSFPTINYPLGQTAGNSAPLLKKEWVAEYGASYLGDIVISYEKAIEQALEFNHPLERELLYLAVHGVFHLCGYDHMNDDDQANMRIMEEKVMQTIGLNIVTDEELLRKARESMQLAYAPYSRFKVGACLLSQDGRCFTGCNVENASYGLTNCAERTAVFKAVSEGCTDFQTIAISAESEAPWPCGACRQVLSEFAPDIRIIVTWGEGEVEESRLSCLLPKQFKLDRNK